MQARLDYALWFRNDYRLKRCLVVNAEMFRLSIVSEKCFDKTFNFNAGFEFVYDVGCP